MKKIVAALLLVLPAFANAASPLEFAGKWIQIKYPGIRAEVESNGNGNAFTFTTYNDRITKKYVAVAEHGVLKISAGTHEAKADIEARTGNLIFGGQEYRRLRPGEKFEFVPKSVPRF